MSKRGVDVQQHDPKMRPEGNPAAALTWHDPRQPPFGIAGLAWLQQDKLYRRLPQQPKHALPPAVDSLANCPAGAQIRFQTNSRKVAVRVTLSARANMNHMPATGQCGFDCYIGAPGKLRYANTTKYNHTHSSYECPLVDLPESASRNLTLYFPLYQGVDEVWVGLEQGCSLQAPPPFALSKPLVIYGTSITQGGCAARPGMAFSNILSRRLNVETINLGFSGSGKGEPEVAKTIGEISDPACLVLDYEGNCQQDLQATLPEFIRILRQAHPTVPILIVSMVRFAVEQFNGESRRARLERRDFQAATIAQLRSAGDTHLEFFDMGAALPPAFEEGTVDGVHPTDLGFYLIANALEPVLSRILFAAKPLAANSPSPAANS